jgi:hypothetical protein
MIVSKKHKFVYLRPPRTASGTIVKTLSQYYETKGIEGDLPHQTVWKPEFDGFFTFISIRNPFPRMVSLWKQMTAKDTILLQWVHEITRLEGKISFQDYVTHPALQAELRRRRCAAYTVGVPKIDALIHHGRLKQELSALPFVHLRSLNIMSKHQSKYTRPWKEEYTPELVKRVQELWEEDFDTFEYSTNIEDCR